MPLEGLVRAGRVWALPTRALAAFTAPIGTRRRRRRPSRPQAEAIVRSARDAITAFSLDGRVISWNPAAERMYGYREEEVIGRSIELLAPGPEQLDELLGMLERVRHGHHAEAHETVRRRKDGSLVDVSVTIAPIRNGGRRIIGAAAVARELDPARRVTAAQDDRFRRTFEDAPIGMAIVDEQGRIAHANDALARLNSLSLAQLQAGSLWELIAERDLDAARAALRTLLAGDRGKSAVELQFERRSGPPAQIAMHLSLIDEAAAGGARQVLVQCHDVTAQSRRASRLQFLAERDPLTGLWNRRKFEDELFLHHLQVNRYGPEGAVLMVDIDDFKAANDTLGHHAGDRLLVSVANLLRSRLRESDLVARIGGDEFAIVLPRASIDEAVEVARAINDAVRGSHLAAGPGRELTVSIGIAPFDPLVAAARGGTTLVQADRAMYEAKRAGRDRYAVFTAS